MYCKNCGAQILEDADVCVNCGKLVKQTNLCENSNKETNYILFAILFGCLGVHNFYIGKTKKATIQLLLTLCSCFILSIPVSIWAMVEAFNYEEEINK